MKMKVNLMNILIYRDKTLASLKEHFYWSFLPKDGIKTSSYREGLIHVDRVVEASSFAKKTSLATNIISPVIVAFKERDFSRSFWQTQTMRPIKITLKS